MTVQILNLLDITIEVSVIIVLITIIRIKLKEYLNPNAVYFLWIFVLLCTLIPIRLGIVIVPEDDTQRMIANIPQSVIDNIPLVEVTKASDISTDDAESISTVPLGNEDSTDSSLSSVENKDDMERLPYQTEEDSSNSFILLPYLIWGLTAAIITLYVIVVNIRFYLYAKRNREEVGICEDYIKIYSLKGYNCLMGIFSPAIYIDEESLKEDALIDNIIRHEYQHYRLKDNIWQFFRIVCLILQWHNPFMWWAYYASKRDCELACDMRVVKNMTKEERYLYGDSLLVVLKQKNKRMDNTLVATSMGETGKRLKERIKLIMKFKNESMVVPAVIIACLIGVVSLFALNIVLDKNQQTVDENTQNNIISLNNISADGVLADIAGNVEDTTEEDGIRLQIDINIQDYYSTNIGDPSNLYHIDEEGVLWGCGYNGNGQLGQGIRDSDFHEGMTKIAENVIHVDYSQHGFAVFLTEDHKLYGMGNANSGALLEYADVNIHSGNDYCVSNPKLLMENVVYARCGSYDVVCLLEDGSVWKLGTGMINGIALEPEKILENAVFITGGFYNHAALLQDGSVWTWGYNFAGNCGVSPEETIFVRNPVKVAENVVMVWTDTAEYNVNQTDISEFGGHYRNGRENTIILKNNGTYWACGIGLGEMMLVHGSGIESMEDTYIICTSEFIQIENENDLTPKN